METVGIDTSKAVPSCMFAFTISLMIYCFIGDSKIKAAKKALTQMELMASLSCIGGVSRIYEWKKDAFFSGYT